MNHNETYKQQIREAIETHGSLFSIPAEERYLIMERHRAGEVLRKYEGSVNPNVLREYGIPGTIVKEICGDADWQVVKKTKRAQKRQKVEKWCSEHAGEAMADIVSECPPCEDWYPEVDIDGDLTGTIVHAQDEDYQMFRNDDRTQCVVRR